MTGPWEFDQARAAAAAASRAQAAAEEFVRESAKQAAKAEEAYRVALSEAIVRLHADGMAWSVCGDVARGDKRVARLRMERDIALGVREAAGQAAWRRTADRKDVQSFMSWSARRELAEGGQPAWTPEAVA